jgi:hypothetical protein
MPRRRLIVAAVAAAVAYMAKAPKTFKSKRPSAIEGLRRAEKLKAHAADPATPDDPDWLNRRAESWQRWSEHRQDSRVRKAENRRKAKRKSATQS